MTCGCLKTLRSFNFLFIFRVCVCLYVCYNLDRLKKLVKYVGMRVNKSEENLKNLYLAPTSTEI